MTRKTYCGNLLWQSGLTLLAPKKPAADEMTVVFVHPADPARVPAEF